MSSNLPSTDFSSLNPEDGAHILDLPLHNYAPLDEVDGIRILDLQPALNENEPLRGTLRTTTRTETRPSYYKHLNRYEAVSYAWGDPTPTSTIICNGNSLIRTAANIDVLLRRVRRKRKVRHLWIDAICLNQSDKREKSHQVPNMHHIYSQAVNVSLAW